MTQHDQHRTKATTSWHQDARYNDQWKVIVLLQPAGCHWITFLFLLSLLFLWIKWHRYSFVKLLWASMVLVCVLVGREIGWFDCYLSCRFLQFQHSGTCQNHWQFGKQAHNHSLASTFSPSLLLYSWHNSFSTTQESGVLKPYKLLVIEYWPKYLDSYTWVSGIHDIDVWVDRNENLWT